MWRVTDSNNEILLGYDGDDYVGKYATEFIAWASLWHEVIRVSPVGPVLKYPFNNNQERFLAAQTFLREARITEAVDAVPPAGMDKYDPEPDVMY